jgi:hypothetical protein
MTWGNSMGGGKPEADTKPAPVLRVLVSAANSATADSPTHPDRSG